MSQCLLPSLRRPLRPAFLLSLPRAASYDAARVPLHAPKQLPHPSADGFFNYTRNWSRDKRFDLSRAPQPGNTPKRFLFRRLDHNYELYPLLFLIAFWWSILCVSVVHGFEKIEIWLDKSKEEPPWDWDRIHDKYYKMPTLFYDPEGKTHQRLDIMETLEDEMLDAAKKRGTRK